MAAYQNAPQCLQMAKRGGFTWNAVDAEPSWHHFHAHPTICCLVSKNTFTQREVTPIRGWMMSLDKLFSRKTSMICQDVGESTGVCFGLGCVKLTPNVRGEHIGCTDEGVAGTAAHLVEWLITWDMHLLLCLLLCAWVTELPLNTDETL